MCKRTWTIRPKRRGRKRIRYAPNLITFYFSRDIATIRNYARRISCGRDRVQRLLRRSLMRYVKIHETEWMEQLPPEGNLIAIADGMWHRINTQRVTTYIILLRAKDNTEAVICPPITIVGHEDRNGWEQAFLRVPGFIRRRIGALVCDGHIGLVRLGERMGWRVQRCHFHLLANLELYIGSRRHPRAQELISCVRRLIAATDDAEICSLIHKLRILLPAFRSRGIHRIISGLLTHYRDFQTYLCYPDLHLPTTTNACESCINGVRDIMRRCRGFRNKESTELWLRGYAIWKKSIRCNGKNQQNYSVNPS